MHTFCHFALCLVHLFSYLFIEMVATQVVFVVHFVANLLFVFSTTLKNVTPSDSQTLPLIPVFSICFKMTPTPDVKDEASCNL